MAGNEAKSPASELDVDRGPSVGNGDRDSKHVHRVVGLEVVMLKVCDRHAGTDKDRDPVGVANVQLPALPEVSGGLDIEVVGDGDRPVMRTASSQGAFQKLHKVVADVGGGARNRHGALAGRTSAPQHSLLQPDEHRTVRLDLGSQSPCPSRNIRPNHVLVIRCSP